jgi:hypothetical protein
VLPRVTKNSNNWAHTLVQIRGSVGVLVFCGEIGLKTTLGMERSIYLVCTLSIKSCTTTVLVSRVVGE